MNVHVIHDGAGRIHGTHRTVDGAAHSIAGHASRPTLGGEPLTILALDRALDRDPVQRVAFSDAPDLVIERHALSI